MTHHITDRNVSVPDFRKGVGTVKIVHHDDPFDYIPPWYQRRWVIVLFLLFSYGTGAFTIIATVLGILMLNFAYDNIKAIEYANSLPL